MPASLTDHAARVERTDISQLQLSSSCRYYAICRPLEARHLHTVRRAAVIVGAFWLLAAAVVAPQLFVQRLEPVLVLDVRPPPSSDLVGATAGAAATASGVASSTSNHAVPTATVRLAYVCVEYFSELRWSITYTLFYYVILYVLPVIAAIQSTVDLRRRIFGKKEKFYFYS